jgi:hypothetical protein
MGKIRKSWKKAILIAVGTGPTWGFFSEHGQELQQDQSQKSVWTIC